jgi:hypothetical protein
VSLRCVCVRVCVCEGAAGLACMACPLRAQHAHSNMPVMLPTRGHQCVGNIVCLLFCMQCQGAAGAGAGPRGRARAAACYQRRSAAGGKGVWVWLCCLAGLPACRAWPGAHMCCFSSVCACVRLCPPSTCRLPLLCGPSTPQRDFEEQQRTCEEMTAAQTKLAETYRQQLEELRAGGAMTPSQAAAAAAAAAGGSRVSAAPGGLGDVALSYADMVRAAGHTAHCLVHGSASAVAPATALLAATHELPALPLPRCVCRSLPLNRPTRTAASTPRAATQRCTSTACARRCVVWRAWWACAARVSCSGLLAGLPAVVAPDAGGTVLILLLRLLLGVLPRACASLSCA